MTNTALDFDAHLAPRVEAHVADGDGYRSWYRDSLLEHQGTRVAWMLLLLSLSYWVLV
jgi:hypothetical protein